MRKLLFVTTLFYCFACSNDASRDAEKKASGLSENEEIHYMNQGRDIAQKSFLALSKQLKFQVSENGVAKAAQYCNVRAIPLIDSLSRVHKAMVRRTSLQVRNELDLPDSVELEVLKGYHQKSVDNEALEPRVDKVGESQILYSQPILVGPYCLQCHGEVGKGIDPEDYKVIRDLYPEDMAINYQAGDFRGIWSILFFIEKNKSEM